MPNEPNFRVTKIAIRCNRAIAPFQHVRAEVEVSVLKGADKEAAREYATKECYKILNKMQSLERNPCKQLDPDEDILTGIDDTKETFPKEPF